MKKLLFITLLFLFFTKPAFAATSTQSAETTATPSSKVSPIEKKAQDLLDRVATKVAAIVDGNKRTYHGKIKSVGDDTLTLTTPDGDKKITTNDATEFYRIRASKTSDTDFKGLKVGDDLVAIGTIDPNSSTMTASQIIAKIKRHVFIGSIQDITTENVAKLKTLTNDTVDVDLSDASYSTFGTDGKVVTAKLADFTKGKTIFVIAHSPDEKTGVYSSLKALILP